MLRKFILSISRERQFFTFSCFFILFHTHATRGNTHSLCLSDFFVSFCCFFSGSVITHVNFSFYSTQFLVLSCVFSLAFLSRCSRIRVSHATKAAPSKCTLFKQLATQLFDAEPRQRQSKWGWFAIELRHVRTAGESERASERASERLTTCSCCSLISNIFMNLQKQRQYILYLTNVQLNARSLSLSICLGLGKRELSRPLHAGVQHVVFSFCIARERERERTLESARIRANQTCCKPLKT